MRVRIEPRPQFRPYLLRKQRWACIVAHRRAGKTVACVQDLIYRAGTHTGKDARFAYIAPHYVQAKDVAWAYLKQFTSGIPGTKTNEGELHVTFAHNGARIRLYGSDNYDRMRGIYLDGAVLDEYGDMDPRAWPEVIRPALSDRKGWATFIGTPKGRNAFWEVHEHSKVSPDWFDLMLRSSETGLVDAQELSDAAAMMTPEQYAQEFECSFDAAILGAYYGALIADAEADGRVTEVDVDPGLPIHTAWDLGIGDSTAIWVFQAGPEGMRLVDHIEDHGKPLGHYVGELEARGYKGGKDFVPHDAKVRSLDTGRSRLETLAGMGRNVILLPAAAVDDGINGVRQLFPRMWFDADKCKLAIEALRQYRADFDEKTKAFKPRPRHDWTSHCFTGDTVILTRSGMRQIMDLPYKGEVLTKCGWKKYRNPRVTRRAAPLVEVRFVGGHTVKCTPDHMFLTESGWKSAEHLAPNTPIQSSLTRSRRISMAAYIGFGQVKNIGVAAAKGFTGKFGGLPLGLYRKIATFTTGTGTPATTCFPIWSAWTRQNTFPLHGKNTKRESSISRKRRGMPPLSGTNRQKAGFGTSATLSDQRVGPSGSGKKSPATIAGKSLMLWFGGAIRSVFATQIAGPPIIERVTHLGERADVWCLTVPGEENFSLANGAIVHNCADALRYAAQGYRDLVIARVKEVAKPKSGQIRIGMPDDYAGEDMKGVRL